MPITENIQLFSFTTPQSAPRDGDTRGHSAKVPFLRVLGILSRHLQNYRGPPSVLQFPWDPPVIRGGYLFSNASERTRPWRDWLRREIHRRHPGVLYRYSLHTYRRRGRDFGEDVLNALAGPRMPRARLLFQRARARECGTLLRKITIYLIKFLFSQGESTLIFIVSHCYTTFFQKRKICTIISLF